MSDYRINFDNMVNTKDATNLSYMLGIIDDNDRLTIVMNGRNDPEAGTIMKVLYENGFDCSTCGGKESDSYYIIAKRNSRNTFEGIH